MTLQQKIDKALSQDKLAGAKRLLQKLFLDENKAKWHANRLTEYETLFKTKKVLIEAITNEDGEIVKEATQTMQLQEDAPTFKDWLNETKSVYIKTITTVDENENEVSEDIYEDRLVRGNYVAQDVSEKVAAYIKANTKPKEVTKVQIMKALKRINMWTTFKNLLASNEDMSDEWDLAISVERNHPFITDGAIALGLDENQVDELFIEAGKL